MVFCHTGLDCNITVQCKTHPWSFVTQALIVISPYNVNNVHNPYTIAEIWVFLISRLKYLQFIKNIINFFVLSVPLWCRRGHDRMVVGFTTTYAISAYHHLMLWIRISNRVRCTTLCDKVCQWLATGEGFLRVLRFPPPIKLIATI